jgi:1-hydroxycarotenoid 3,4-desaturase
MGRPDKSEAAHVAIIGAGMGGLASAIRLASAGCRVTLLDSAPAAGGKMRTVDSPAGPVDAGPTVLTMRHQFDALFALADARMEEFVELVEEPLLARHWWLDGSSLDLFADRDRSVEEVRRFAGTREAEAFRSFSERAQRLFTGFEAAMMESARPTLPAMTATVLRSPALIGDMAPLSSLARSLVRTFRDPRLRQLFGRYATYVGGMPGSSPGVLQLIWHAEASGVWRVHGGMHKLAEALEDLAGKMGVDMRMGAHVTRVEIQDGRVSAVHTETGPKLRVDAAIFNGDPRALRQGLLGAPLRDAVPETAVTPRSLSARVWAFAAETAGPELVHHNVFFGEDPEAEFGPILDGKPPSDPTLYICAQDRGAGTAPPALERFEIIENAAPTDQETPEETDQCRTRVFNRLTEFGLTFTPRPDASKVTTPAAFDRMFPASLGSLYGRSPHGMMAAFRRPTAKTTIPGLYLAGGGAHPGAGIAMAALSGRHAAEAIARDLALPLLSRPTDMPGGTSTASRTMGLRPSRSSLL